VKWGGGEGERSGVDGGSGGGWVAEGGWFGSGLALGWGARGPDRGARGVWRWQLLGCVGARGRGGGGHWGGIGRERGGWG